MTSLKIAFAALLIAIGASAAVAQTTTPAPAAKATAPAAATTTPAADTAKGAKAPRSEKSKACSAEADAKKLHGKPRKAFRKKCMKAA